MKLNVQKWLEEHNDPEKLQVDFGIRVYRHPTLPLVGLKYDQIDSPKTHPVVRECRGLVLEDKTWKVVAKPFNRFFNLGEDLDFQKLFDWKDFIATSKEDGSLIIVYHYDNKWHINTSGSFGFGEVNNSNTTWQELFEYALNYDKFTGTSIKTSDCGIEESFTSSCNVTLNKEHTYVFELCTITNKVVRTYSIPQVYLLGIIHTESDKEKDYQYLIAEAQRIRRRFKNVLGVPRVNTKNIDELNQLLRELEIRDPTFEGFVLRDKNNLRIKVKSNTYESLHKLKGEGDNLYSLKRLLPWAFREDPEELLLYFPEVKDRLFWVQDQLNQHFDRINRIWESSKEIELQKDFALRVKNDPLSSILFQLRKEKANTGTREDILEKIRRAEKILVKILEKEYNERFI